MGEQREGERHECRLQGASTPWIRAVGHAHTSAATAADCDRMTEARRRRSRGSGRGGPAFSQGDHGDASAARSINAQSNGDTAEREHGGTSLMELVQSQLDIGEYARLIQDGDARVAVIGSFDDLVVWDRVRDGWCAVQGMRWDESPDAEHRGVGADDTAEREHSTVRMCVFCSVRPAWIGTDLCRTCQRTYDRTGPHESAQDAVHAAVDACAADVIDSDHDAVWAEAEQARYAGLDAEAEFERSQAFRDADPTGWYAGFGGARCEAGWAALWLLALLAVVLPALIVATRGFGVVSASMGAR